jgi:hypothetical protein
MPPEVHTRDHRWECWCDFCKLEDAAVTHLLVLEYVGVIILYVSPFTSYYY